MTGTAERTQSLPAMVAIASIISVAFAGSVVVTPLYSLYQQKFGFSEITLTLVYAVYVVGNVIALLLLGQVSDQIGRKRVAMPALVLAALSALLFLLATGTTFLFLARLLIGLAVGVASGTGTAWLADEFGPANRSTATVSAAAANLGGIALGPLLGGLLAEYAPWPLELPFIVYIAILAVVAIALSPVSGSRPAGVASVKDVRVRPRVGVPRELYGAFAAPAVTGFVTFALGGLYFALIPGVVIRDLHNTNLAVGGAVVSELAAIAAAVIVLGRRLSPAVAMTSGLVLLLPAVGLVVAAQAAGSMVLLLIATAVGGVTMALGYRGSLQVVNEIAPDDRRAEVTSSYFIACFVGNSVPVIGLGVLSTLTQPLTGTIVFAGTIAALSGTALVWRRAI
ncbi:MAG TPA: MFS transporter [Mycobacteriales bacterium]|nr:MFS transporter [Mycobacteriales bacterium]